MKNNITTIKNCSGCFLCEILCPKQCISKMKNNNGFFTPVVSEARCVECGLCLNVCPCTQKTGNKPIKIFGARNKNSEVLKKSTSGGAFTAVSDWVVSNNGIVFGAVFNDDFDVVHTYATNFEQRDKMRGAKYVKSDITEVYSRLEKFLSKGLNVLFCGTPCQVAAIKSFCVFKKLPVEKLVTIDLICHGTPSPVIFADYLKILQKKFGKLVSYTFRDKTIGWHGQNVTAVFENGKRMSKGFVKHFSTLYFRSYITMESCQSCKYASMIRNGDLTLGDFWGVEKYYKAFSDEKGVSLVMVNTDKGMDIFNKAKSNLEYWSTDENKCMQMNLMMPSSPNIHKNVFFGAYHAFGFSFAYHLTNVYQFIDILLSKFMAIIKVFKTIKIKSKLGGSEK